VVLAVARKYELLSFNVYLPCDVYILGDFSRYIFRVLLVSFSLFRPGIVRAPLLRKIVWKLLYNN